MISLDVRTNLVSGEGVFTQEGFSGQDNDDTSDKDRVEIDYCSVLNRNLPEDIRVTAWAPAPSSEFSARFDNKIFFLFKQK